MANTFVISCPECDKQIKVAEEVVGKKIRCKECGNVFAVKRPKGMPVKKEAKGTNEAKDKPPADAKPAEKPTAAQANAALDEEDDDGKNPYALAKDDSHVPRCPNCVKELESPDDKVCTHCGYDLVTRRRHETKAVYEPTGEDVFYWMLPGILCIVAILVLIGICIFICVKVKGWMAGGWFQDEDTGKWILKPGCFMLFAVMVTGFASYYLGRFAYRRLVVNNKPPEKEIEKAVDDD